MQIQIRLKREVSPGSGRFSSSSDNYSKFKRPKSWDFYVDLQIV